MSEEGIEDRDAEGERGRDGKKQICSQWHLRMTDHKDILRSVLCFWKLIEGSYT